MNNFSHQESIPVTSNSASNESFIRRRRGAVRKQNVHEVNLTTKLCHHLSTKRHQALSRSLLQWRTCDCLVTIKFFHWQLWFRWRRNRWHKASKVDSFMSTKSADRPSTLSTHSNLSILSSLSIRSCWTWD